MSVMRRIRNWLSTMQELGLEIAEVDVGSKHVKVRLTSGHVEVLSKTPTDWRGDRNALARLRRMADRPEKAAPKPRERPRRPAAIQVSSAPRPPSLSGWKPGMGHAPERIQCAAARQRLGLDGRRVPAPHPLPKLDRPVLTLPRRQD